MAESRPLGFDALKNEDEPAGYTVQFTPSEDPEPQTPDGDKKDQSEEIGLLERSSEREVLTSPTEEEKKLKSNTIMFEDGVTLIDFILTYQDKIEQKKGEENSESKEEKRRTKRETYIKNCEEAGLVFEHQDCSESPDHKTHYLKVHGTHDALLRGAEDLLLRMPVKVNNLKTTSLRERFFDAIKIRDPFEPVVPRHLKTTSYFTAPFSYDRRTNFIGWDDEKNFFTGAQRSAIVYNILLNCRYGEDDDQIGLLRLLANNSFTAGFPLHEGREKLDIDQTDEDMTDRQFLYHRWSRPINFYKRQPLNQIRRYFGEKIGIYFTWLGFYTTWLLPASLVGLIVFLYGLSTVNSPLRQDICSNELRYNFYMCPRCDEKCDFWYLNSACRFAPLILVFDNGATVFFAIFMSFWAVLFLEFWKRRQFTLQYEWDVLGFEESEQRARPEFEQKIKRHIKKCKKPEDRKKFIVHNPVLDKDEYLQPLHWFYPKFILGFSIVSVMVLSVIAIVFFVLLYRLAVAGLIFRALNGLPLGPSVGDIIVSITGAAIQLIAIIIMNKIYEFLAYRLTKWELHRTQTDFDDNFIVKMYLFQFFNFYTSLFYIAFFKGNLSGSPGNYIRIFGTLRFDECATYGCLLELTIQLFIIMVGKQVLNNIQELSIPYVKRFVNCLKHKEETDTDVYTRWEKDYDLVPLSQHGLFFEYLELVIQYGFTTLFVAALPLTPLFAVLNNWIEIRLDAHKFMVVLRRPIAERAGDLGAWYNILAFISNFAVVTNAFLISITAQFIPIEVFARTGRGQVNENSTTGTDRLSGYVDWSLTNFTVDKLINNRTFPSYAAQKLPLYDLNGNELETQVNGRDSNYLYLPFVNFSCFMERSIGVPIGNFSTNLVGLPPNGDNPDQFYTITETHYRMYVAQNETNRNLILKTANEDTTPPEFNSIGECFKPDTLCRFRGYEEDGGFEGSGGSRRSITIFGSKFWQVLTARLAFVIVFEHFIFIIINFLAFIIPDVPQSVKNEIQREKLLAYEAVHARKEKEKEFSSENEESGKNGKTGTESKEARSYV